MKSKSKKVSISSSEYINEQRRQYSLYVMDSRAIPSITDGLKAAGRRVLWTARDGKKVKSATLAGATMPIHPHASPEGAIDNLTAPFKNNMPLFTGHGTFGTLIEPSECAASRYTSVSTSEFTKDVLFKDIEIVPMMENYDGTLMEPVHFLPLSPIALLNPIDNIAIGFASTILPRDFGDVVRYQLAHLKKQRKKPKLVPTFTPLTNVAHTSVGNAHWFKGEFVRTSSTMITVTKLPFGVVHQKFTELLIDLQSITDPEVISIEDFDDYSKTTIDIQIKFKRGVLAKLTDDDIISLLKLDKKHTELLTMLDFSHSKVIQPTVEEAVEMFTDWRLTWYVQRYQRLKDIALNDIQRFLDVRIAIANDAGGLARAAATLSDLKSRLAGFGIVDVDYIASLPVYRFTDEEKRKNEEKIKATEILLKHYENLLTSEEARCKVYIEELEFALGKYSKGQYSPFKQS